MKSQIGNLNSNLTIESLIIVINPEGKTLNEKPDTGTSRVFIGGD